MESFSVLLLLLLCVSTLVRKVAGELSSGRIKGDDEPHIVSWRVLEGITEPFESNQQESIPAWKQMKNAADQKAAGLVIQQALHEYGQLLRHPYMFGDMPTEERYDVFLSMAKLLKTMGFHQRAELLLYEAMSYTTNPHEAHLQLGLLFLDKEDLEKAKIHLKNCLFFKENDVLILIHLSVILIAEGRIHEAKFFLSRILSGLEARVQTLSFMLSPQDINSITTERVDYKVLSTWVEDLIVKVFYGEFRYTPSSTMEMLKLFSNLYRWISEGELVGRFIFDLGQSLYEGGRPKIGQMMMKRGFDTSDATVEGEVSTAIVNMRLALDYPVVPDSLLEILESYLNMTNFLSTTSPHYVAIDVENVVDLYWPLPLLGWSALPMMPVVKELLWRFEGGHVRTDALSAYWLSETSYDDIMQLHHPQREILPQSAYRTHSAHKNSAVSGTHTTSTTYNTPSTPTVDKEQHVHSFESIKSKDQQVNNGIKTIVIPPTSPDHNRNSNSKVKVEVGIFGGHMNNHPVGQMVFRRILGLHAAPVGSGSGKNTDSIDWRELISLTLLALPLVPDTMTKRIASGVTKIVNLPMDTAQAWRIIENLHLDIIIFPDWQPFPDQQSTLFQSRRMAPVQVCFYVRGSSCGSVAIDYYLLPMELEAAYLSSTPAADLLAKVAVNTTVAAPHTNTGVNSISSRPVIPQEGSFDPAHAGSVHAEEVPIITRTTEVKYKTIQKSLRPQWREFYSEQVVLLDWPILTPLVVQGIAQTVTTDETSAQHRRTQASNPASSLPSQFASAFTAHTAARTTETALDDSINTMFFSPLEIEGKIFFENQPVAVLPIYPTYVNPLMDDVLFKIMRAVPSLHVVLALPESFFTHAREAKHKISWARKLVRRLWSRGGSLFHRIRLLPSPLSDQRLLQLLRQADMVLDTFPVGSSFYFLSLAISVGTPVITLRSGTSLHSSKEDLQEMRTFLAQHRAKQRQNNITVSNPMAQYVTHFDLPYAPAMSAINGFYERIHMGEFFIANSTAEYFQLASKLVTDREFAYSLRVRLLEAVDGQRHHLYSTTSISASTNAAGASHAPPAGATAGAGAGDGKVGGPASGNTGSSTAGSSSATTMEDWEEEQALQQDVNTAGDPTTENSAGSPATNTAGEHGRAVMADCGHCVDDLGRFFLSVGVPYARARTWRVQSMQQQRTGTAPGATAKASGAQQTDSSGGKNNKRRTRSRAAADSEGNEDFHGAGAIS